MENLWHTQPCLKCHVHNERTGLRRVYVGIGSPVCIINLLIVPVGNVLMRLSCQELRILVGKVPGNYHCESYTCAW